MLTTQQEYSLWSRLSPEDREQFSQMTPHDRENYANQIWTAEEFVRRNPGWNGTENNSRLLRQALEHAIDSGATFNADTLSACYHHLNAAGKFEPAKPEVVTESEEEHLQRRHIEELAKHAHQMSDADLEKALLRAGVYVSSRSTI